MLTLGGRLCNSSGSSREANGLEAFRQFCRRWNPSTKERSLVSSTNAHPRKYARNSSRTQVTAGSLQEYDQMRGVVQHFIQADQSLLVPMDFSAQYGWGKGKGQGKGKDWKPPSELGSNSSYEHIVGTRTGYSTVAPVQLGQHRAKIAVAPAAEVPSVPLS
eukprot:3051233-Amphidinium_carterae.1